MSPSSLPHSQGSVCQKEGCFANESSIKLHRPWGTDANSATSQGTSHNTGGSLQFQDNWCSRAGPDRAQLRDLLIARVFKLVPGLETVGLCPHVQVKKTNSNQVNKLWVMTQRLRKPVFAANKENFYYQIDFYHSNSRKKTISLGQVFINHNIIINPLLPAPDNQTDTIKPQGTCNPEN